MKFVPHTQAELKSFNIVAGTSYKIKYVNKDYYNGEETIEQGSATPIFSHGNIYFTVGMDKMVMKVAPIVDEYLTNRATKMYEKAIKSQNKLFSKLCSSQKTVAWIIDRWINTFVNLTSNPAYKDYIDISKIKIAFNDEISTTYSNIEDILEFEKLQKLPKEQIIKALKFIWDDGYFDSSLDKDDIEELCKKFDLNIKDVFGTEDLVKLNLKKEQTESGHSQLVFVF
ncbi:MAG: hypothetical protein PHU40_08235 [Sulfurimonas sp.]|nr:hypothetical protein [Sulfurimonas sp.]